MNTITNKKAFTIQFSWIFVLFVGFLVMIFVISSISKQESTSKSDINLEITKNVDSILTSAEQSSNTFKKISIPETEIIRVCEEDYSAYSINNNIQRVDNSVFFMPKKMNGKIIYSWALHYSMPMKITNILYLTTPKHMYIFVNNTGDNLIENIYDDFPKNLTHEMINFVDFKNYKGRNYDSYVFILINKTNEINSLQFPSNSEIKKKGNVIVITYDGINRQKGNIKFYDYSSIWKKVGSEKFIDKSILYGAIFAGDYNGYICNANKLLKKSKTIYTIYNYTLTKQKEQATKFECISHYNESLDLCQELINLNNSDGSTLEKIYSTSIELNLKNKNLLTKGCPLIY